MSRYARRYVRDPGRPAALAVRAAWGRKTGYVRGIWPLSNRPVAGMARVMHATRDRAGVDRLTGPELSCFVPETRGWPADIGVIAILDGAGLFGGDGRLRITDLRAAIAGRLHQAPRLRQVVYVHVANVPGPASPLYLAGACLTEAFAVVPLSGNVTVGIGVVSYAGQLNISVIADRDNCPDLPVFISGLDRSLSGLTGAAAMSITPPAGGPAA